MSEQREVLSVTPELDCTNYLEVGGRAVWAVSSAKPGNGAEQLRDGDTGSFWQSDGTHPHTISVQFLHKTDVCRVCLYVDYAVDESYTPKRVAVRSGSCAHDLVDVAALDLADPVGWVGIDVQQIEYDPSSSLKSLVPLRTHLLQIKIVSMHQNGRDTHVRQVKLLGRRSDGGGAAEHGLSTVDMTQFAVLR